MSGTQFGFDAVAAMVAAIPLSAVAGGGLIGLAAVLLYASIGRIAGVSGILFASLGRSGGWRRLFLLGIVLGALLAAHTIAPEGGVVSRPSPGVLVLALAGFLVGWGTRLGGGCTSGHGVCGLGRLAPRSAVAVLAFMFAGIFAASILRHWFGGLS